MRFITKLINTSRFRSTNANTQDYVKPLRYLPSIFKDRKRLALATEVRARRDQWLADLLQEVKDKVTAGKAPKCVAAGLLTETQGRLDSCKRPAMIMPLDLLTA
jgi:phenylacetate 2-hydroxylase